MISPADPVGADIVESLAEFGYDYIELSMAGVAALPEAAFNGLAERLRRSGIRCEALNNFFPARVRLTGDQARLDLALEYADHAMDRASALGAEIIVFGSSGAKNVPAGFPMDAAWRQIVELLRYLGPMAAKRNLTIAIEPLNRGEANIVNLGSDGLRLARETGHSNVQLLIDYYHLAIENENPAIIVEAGSTLRHTHFAKVEGRTFPDAVEEDYSTFFAGLRRIAYPGRCSIEAYTKDFAADARRGLAVMRQLASATGD
jgi:sugar phosphate isomerase/epimerase